MDTMIKNGNVILKYIHNAPGTTLGEIRYNMFADKAAPGLIEPETVAYHSLHANLQTQNWMLLQSISLKFEP